MSINILLLIPRPSQAVHTHTSRQDVPKNPERAVRFGNTNTNIGIGCWVIKESRTNIFVQLLCTAGTHMLRAAWSGVRPSARCVCVDKLHQPHALHVVTTRDATVRSPPVEWLLALGRAFMNEIINHFAALAERTPIKHARTHARTSL